VLIRAGIGMVGPRISQSVSSAFAALAEPMAPFPGPFYDITETKFEMRSSLVIKRGLGWILFGGNGIEATEHRRVTCHDWPKRVHTALRR
jgi:hypothetical protein